MHGEEIVLFFLQHFDSTHEVEPRGIRIIVYTRFDSDTVDPESLALTFGRSAEVNANIAAPSVDN